MKNWQFPISAALAAAVLLANHEAHAQPATSRFCNDQLIKGTYGFVVDGELFLAPPPGLLKGVGMITFDGKGGLTQIDSISVNGTAAPGFSKPATGSYRVNDDCTGSFSLVFHDPNAVSPPVTVNFVVTTNGFEIDTVVVGVCFPPESPPCTGQGANSVRSTLKRRFIGVGN